MKDDCGKEYTTIVRNLGDFKTYWTVEIDKKFSKKQAIHFNMKVKELLTHYDKH